jgi:hypothetical protein
MADIPKFPTRDEYGAMRARVQQAKHVPSGLAMGDVQRLQLFADLDRLLDLVEPAIAAEEDRANQLGLQETEPSVVE